MNDMHVHLKEGIYNQNIFNEYVKRCIELGIEKVVFLDHGNRISLKHKPVLNTKDSINLLIEKVKSYNNKNLIIYYGIEIDYSTNNDFRNETFKILNYGNFEWVVGAIHSMKFESLKQYLECVLDMINNYDINVIAHLMPSNEYAKYEYLLIDILKICHNKNIAIEINTSKRSLWSDELLYYFLDLLEKYKVNYVFGSDAHQIAEIGQGIKEAQEKVLLWKKRK